MRTQELELTKEQKELLSELLFEGPKLTETRERLEAMGEAALEAYGQAQKAGRTQAFMQELREAGKAAFEAAKQTRRTS